MLKDQKIWLVKSSGRILGPFRESEISERLKSREISVVDEVAEPLRRWHVIQIHPHFHEMVTNLRHQSLNELTEANWTPTNTDSTSVTQTLTDLANSGVIDDLTDTAKSFKSLTKEIVIESEEDSSPVPIASGGRFQLPSEQSKAVAARAESTAKWLWITTIIVLALVGGYVMFRRAVDPVKPSSLSLAAVRQSVINDVQVGRYAEALKLMKSFFATVDGAGELSIYYGILAIQLEGQTTLGRRLLSQVIDANRPERKQAFTGLGVADMMDGNWSAAQKNFQAALLIDPDYFPALTNLAIVYSRLGKKSKADESAWNTFRRYPLNPEPLLLLAQWATGPNKELQDRLRAFGDSQWHQLVEVRFFEMVLGAYGRATGINQKVREFLDIDPRISVDHRKNFFVYRRGFDWSNWQDRCQKIVAIVADPASASALRAACHAQEERWDLARVQIEQAAHQSPKDPLIQAWFAYILGRSGDLQQASVVLGRSNEFNRSNPYKLPTLLQARFCQEQGDFKCARENWQRLYDRDVDLLAAVTGLAWAGANDQNHDEASKYLERGLRLSPDYIPLLTLRQIAESGGWYGSH